MTAVSVVPAANGATVQPADVLYGLGSADRSLLAACLGLFEDSTLSRQLNQHFAAMAGAVRRRVGVEEVRESTASVQTCMSDWFDSALADDELRLVLWIYLCGAFGLPARLTVSRRGAEALATQLAVAAVHAVDPPGFLRTGRDLLSKWGWMEKEARCATLSDIVLPVFQEMMSAAFNDGDGCMGVVEQARLIASARKRLEGMSQEEQQRILEAIGARELNDAAMRQILLTGGGLTAFSASVGLAGFSAYILAAQASAFIPFVSGPALVSVVAVMSNPVTVIAATAGAAWWAASSATDKAKVAVGIRVLALLALQGLSGRSRDPSPVLAAFASIEGMHPRGDLEHEVIERYKADWQLISAARGKQKALPTLRTLELVNRVAFDGASPEGRLGNLLFEGSAEGSNAAAVAALTLGDILFAAAAIDPTVIEAADFSRIEDIDSRLAFAEFARKIHELAPDGYVGALSSLKGYVAERVVAAELVMLGHDVSFPDASNHAGWDILVDGHEFQVKCLEGIGGLQDHFDTYSFPVFVNSELAGHIPAEWADHVFFVEGYSDQLVTHVTETSLDAGAGVFHPHVPLFAMGISALRNFGAYQEGRVSAIQAVEQIIMDGGTRAGLAAIGGYAGSAIGLLVFGPAGALVLGGVIPVLSQAQTSRLTGALDAHIRTQRYRDWAEQAQASIDALCQCLTKVLEKKLGRLRTKWKVFSGSGMNEYIRARLEDEAAYLNEAKARLTSMGRTEFPFAEQRAIEVIRWAAGSTIHSIDYQAELKRLQEVVEARPPLTDRLNEMGTDAWDQIRGWYQKLGK
jgi:hypothetical protein